MRKRLIFLIARLVPSVLTALTAAILTRILEPAEYGLYAFSLSITFFLGLAAFEWLGLSMLRMAPMTTQPDLFFGTVTTCFRVLVGFSTAVTALVVLIGGFEDYAMLAVASLVTTFSAAWLEMKLRLQMAGLQDMKLFATSISRAVATAVLVTGAAALTRSASAMLFAFGAANLLVSIFAHEPRLKLFNHSFDFKTCRALLDFGFPLAISVGLATALVSVDKVMLQGLLGPHAVGLFAAATLIGQAPISALASGIGPWAYSMAVRALEFESAEVANAQLGQNFIVLIGVIVPAAFGIVALSGNFAHLLLGQAFWESSIVLTPWLAATAVASGIRAFYVDIAFQLAHRTRPLVWTTLSAVVANVALDYWLIPPFGLLGAAVGSFSAVMISLVASAYVSKRVYPLPLPIAVTAKVVCSATIMFFALLAVRSFSRPASLTWQIPLGMAVYSASLFVFNVLGLRTRCFSHPR